MYRPRGWMARLSRRTRRVLGLAAGAAALGWAAREYAMRSDGWFVRADPARAGRRGRGHRAAGHQRADETNGPRLLRLEREVADADETGDDLGRQHHHHHHHHGGDRSRSSAASSSCAGSRRDSFDHGSDAGGDDGTNTSTSGPSLNDQSQHGSGDAATPNFFASTKFFACLELEESQELFAASEEFDVPPNTVVFRQGDDSSSGIYIVVQGSLGVYLQENQADDDGDGDGDEEESTGSDGKKKEKREKERKVRGTKKAKAPLGPPFLTNILREGESVGDIDVLDNAPRGVSCITQDDGARLVRVKQATLMEFIRAHPHTLETYVQQAVARLWRVAHFVLVDFLGLPRGPPTADAVSLEEPPLRTPGTRRGPARGASRVTAPPGVTAHSGVTAHPGVTAARRPRACS